MRYMLLIYRDDDASEARSAPEVKAAVASHVPYIELLRRNSQYITSDALGPARSAWTVRNAGGKLVATEGPFAETREQFGGFYVIEADDLDEAIAAASLCPALALHGFGIEIRPLTLTGVAPELLLEKSERTFHSRYLLAIYLDESPDDPLDDLDRQQAFAEPYLARLGASGQIVGAGLLAPSGSATSLRLRNGKVVLTDAPIPAGREQLRGYCMVGARDMDEAVKLALRCFNTQPLAIEVRSVRGAGG
jgi:hypothetical protein